MSIIVKDAAYTYMKNTPYESHALKRVSLEIKEGEFVAVIGHTGSGKSTLLQHMKGLLSPSCGSVYVDGVNINERTAAARAAKNSIGMVFQYPEQQLFEETIYGDIAFGPRNMGLDEREVEKRVKLAMEFVNLDFAAYKDRSPFELSGGQMRRVAIAGVFAMQPKYLILDEPAAGLDPIGKAEIFAKIAELNEKAGVAIIFISHDMDDVARLATRLIVMNEGSVKFDAAPREVFAHEKELSEMGLDIPSAAKLLKTLVEHGFTGGTLHFTVADAVAEISRVLRGEKNV
jgi:energy-coupling factor transport system ATP-binding protein